MEGVVGNPPTPTIYSQLVMVAQTCNWCLKRGLSPEPVGSALTLGRECRNGAELQGIPTGVEVGESVGVGETHT